MALCSCACARLVVVRHGETVANAEGWLQGQLDVPLNDRGREQARATGAAIALRFTPRAIVSSDLCRAYATAEAIASATGLPAPARDERLRETHLGSWQGQPWGSADARDVAAWRGDPDVCAPGGGESSRQRFHRVCAAVYEAALTSIGATAVLVAHGGVIDDIGRLALATPWGRGTALKKHNCAICVLEFTPRGGRTVDWDGAGATTPVAARAVVSSCPALDVGVIEPAGAAAALGEWRVVEWGDTAHLRREGTRLDPFADAAHAGGAAAEAALPLL